MAEAKRADSPSALRRGGRPRKDDRQSVALTVWATPADAQRLRQAAAERRESVSSFLAESGRSQAGRPLEQTRAIAGAELRRVLGPIASNLNQLTRSVNAALLRNNVLAVREDLERHQATLRDLGAALLKLQARR